MNRLEIETFRRRVRDLQEQYEHALREIERDEARRRGVLAEAVAGEGRSVALEAQTRTCILDPLLDELGWEIRTAASMVVEDAVEPPNTGPDAYRRRLDYHGRDHNQGRSLLVVEAKRPSFALPQTKAVTAGPLMAESLRAMNGSGTASALLPSAWCDALGRMCDYVRRLEATYGAAPARCVITNGEWFLIFKDVTATLLASDPVANEIAVFGDLSEIAARAEQFLDLLSYQSLSGHVPAQHPAALCEFIPEGQEAVCARVIDVSHVRHGERQPLISVRVGIWVRTPRGAWILFQKEYAKEFLVLSDDRDELAKCREALTKRATSVLEELRAVRPVRFASMQEFEGSVHGRHRVGEASERASALVRELAPNRYRVVTVDQVLYLTEDGSYDKCPGHEWGTCLSQGNAVGQAPITAPSSDPRCFFPSGSPYHCSHAVAQARRNKVCVLLPFEERLCCKRCAFLHKCWPDQQAMPCETN